MPAQQLPLIGGSYSARSVIANAQRCLNLFPEANRKDSTSPVTHYQRPGLTPLVLGIRAYGTIFFAGNPSIADTITMNGVVWTFIAGASSGTNIHIAGSLALTLVGAALALNGSVDPLISVATYSSPSVAGDTLVITYDTIGVGGNAYTLSASVAMVSGPHLTLGATFGGGVLRGRALYQASNADCYAVIGTVLYLVNSDFSLTFVGDMGGVRTNPCSMIDNGIELLLVDGSLASGGVGGGWTVTLGANNDFTVVNDMAWTGADRVDYIDTFIVWNQPGTALFGSTTSDTILPLDPLYVAGKAGYPDPLQSIIVSKRQIMLPGLFKSEIWYDAGNLTFPFAELQGSYIEHGVAAKYSIASADENVFWLSRDLQGQGYVLKHSGNETKRISNYALEYQIRLMYQNGGTIADAVGYVFQVDGHLFYVLSFPEGNQTWVYDDSVSDPQLAWSQRGWTDSNGTFNRDRGVLGAALHGRNTVIDWQYGTIYDQSMTTYVDTVAGQDYPIQYLRTFPHLMMGVDPATGQPILASGKIVQHDSFMLDVTVGTGPAGPSGGQPPVFTLRWSDDRGQSWQKPITLEAGEKGKFLTRPTAKGLGQAQDRVYEVSWSFPGEVALNGAWVEGRVLNN